MLISRSEVKKLLSMEECMAAVEMAFKLHAQGKVQPPKIIGLHTDDGGFHIKAGQMNLGRNYFVAKVNANFPDNRKMHNLPTIQGVIVVSDASNGRLLALLDSIEITIVRTGAATGVAAKYLSRHDAKLATVVGCGNQGRISLRAILTVRKLEKVFAYDIDESQKQSFVREVAQEFGINVVPTDDLETAVQQSDICITCTPSKTFFLKKEFVKPGTFIAAVGADSEDKQELEPSLLRSANLVVDLLDQSATIGELHHALESGTMKRTDVHAELGEIIAGLKPGRVSNDEIFVFDSTGMALQDVAASSIVYERAIASRAGRTINLAE